MTKKTMREIWVSVAKTHGKEKVAGVDPEIHARALALTGQTKSEFQAALRKDEPSAYEALSRACEAVLAERAAKKCSDLFLLIRALRLALSRCGQTCISTLGIHGVYLDVKITANMPEPGHSGAQDAAEALLNLQEHLHCVNKSVNDRTFVFKGKFLL